MTAAAKKDSAVEVPVAWENPLIPNRKLRALYVAMVELRLLDEHLSALPGRTRSGVETIRGEEGCRVSTTFDLTRGDLTSETSVGGAFTLLRGAQRSEIIRRRPKPGTGHAIPAQIAGQLAAMANPLDRLHLAMGAAIVLKSTRKAAILVAYLHSDEVALAAWKPILRFASEQALPLIFVVLSRKHQGQQQAGRLSLVSSRCGVPGIPVDAADPVALYRVAQESMLRARAGGGPVLMECVSFQPAGKKLPVADPIETMREFLLHRRIVDDAWLQGVEKRFNTRLQTAIQQA